MRRKHLKRIQKQNSFLFRTTCAVLLACNLVAASAQKETSLLLVKNGKSPYSIIIPAQPTTADTRAAEIFRQSIFRISGAELPVLTDQTATRRYEISIGNTNRLKKLAGKYIPDLSKDPDGYAVISEKGKIYIVGGIHKGVVYGVVSILEKYLGCRKYSPDFDYFPKLTDVRLPSIKISDRPPIPSASSMEPLLRIPIIRTGNVLTILMTFLQKGTTFIPSTDWFLGNNISNRIRNTLP